MKQLDLRKLAIAASTVAFAALFSVSIDGAQARRLYVGAYHHNPYIADASGLSWYAVRAYYQGGPWSNYHDWADYAQQNGIGCTPGTLIKGGDGIMYVCQ